MLDNNHKPVGSLMDQVRLAKPVKSWHDYLPWLVVVLGLLLLVSLVINWQLYRTAQNSKQALKKLEAAPAQQQSEENSKLLVELGRLVALPADEQPSIATVSDLSRLDKQPFFANAELGDKVIIYEKSRKAILYRPSQGKVVEFVPITEPGDR